MNFIDVGRIVKDAEVKQLQNTNVIIFTIAIDRRMQKDKSSFVTVNLFRKEDKISQYLTKGTLIKVVGELQVDNTKDDNGNWKTYIKIVADDIKLLGGKKNNSNDVFNNSTFEDDPFDEEPPIDFGDCPF